VLPKSGFLQIKKQDATAIKRKPDLVVHSIKVERTRFLPSGENSVRVTVAVRNAARFKTCSGPLKVKVEKRELIQGRKTPFSRLGEAGIVKLCADPTSMKLQVETRTFQDTVAIDKTYVYRAIVDSMNQIVEENESNNIMLSEAYSWVPECTGVDIVVERVVAFRTDRMGICICAWARNRCGGACTGRMDWVIDETRAGGTGISRNAGSVMPFQEYSIPESSALCPAYRDGETNTYVVSLSPPCADSNPSNNSLTISLGPTQTRNEVRR
jgi:hypothetical protein